MSGSGGAILLVEDNDDDVFLMQRALKKAEINNRLQIVTDGQQAVHYFEGTGQYANRELHPLPFLIFLDLKLPYLNGFEVLRWLQEHHFLESVIVAVLTSSAENKDIEKAYALGAHCYLVKPPTPEMLRAIVGTKFTGGLLVHG